jgi:hypothetical protein
MAVEIVPMTQFFLSLRTYVSISTNPSTVMTLKELRRRRKLMLGMSNCALHIH